MVDSQPGQVTAFDPSVALSGFAAATRDRLMYNENQLVLAKLQQSQPTSTTARTRTGSTTYTDYAAYINAAGEIAYIDGSFQALDTPGRPTTPVHQIIVGFAQQVTTDDVIFWSTSYVDTSQIFVQYSFDNSTWFEVGAVTWVQFFDDTIEQFPGDSPPSGEYRYTGTFDSGDITARYWRIRGDADAEFVSESGASPNKTFTVDSTTNFPSTGTLSAVVGEQSRNMTYTGKSGSTFTGVNDPAGSDEASEIISGGLVGTVNGSMTLEVDDASSLPSSGSVRGRVLLNLAGGDIFYYWDIAYTSKSGDILTGVTISPDPDTIIPVDDGYRTVYYTIRGIIDRTDDIVVTPSTNAPRVIYTALSLFVGVKLFTTYAWGNGVTELQVLGSTDPILEHWNSSGSQAVSVNVTGDSYYDMAYDKNDDVYYAIKFSSDIAGATIADPDDDFSTGDGTGFDTTKWVESTTNSYFQRNTTSGTLDMKSSAGNGQLVSNYGVDGEFLANIDLDAMVTLASPGYFSLEALDYSLGNVHLQSGILAEEGVAISTTATFYATAMTYTDTVGSAATLTDFRVKPEGMDFSFAGGVVDYNFVYTASTGLYAVTVSGISHPDARPGTQYELDSASFKISNFSTPADGEAFSVLVTVSEDTTISTAASGTRLQVERAGTNGYARYEIPGDPGVWVDTHVGNVPTDRFRLQLFGNPASSSVDMGIDNFNLTTSGTVFFNTPVFTVITLDKDGNASQVASVSDANGYAITSLDLIRDTTATYNDYLAPRVGIATNGADVGSGGEIYIKINDTLYRYLKSALPLTSVEDGTTAATTTTGEIPATVITGFAYNGYSQGGLCYVEYDSGLSGTFVRSIDSSSLLAQPEKAWLDVATISYPFAWNVTDLATLYYVDGTDLLLYDLNETKAAFANVSSDKQVLAAGTSETAIITAQVLNVYGEPKSAKTMTFAVSAGDGALSPAIGCSDGNGEDTTTYTVGSAVGAATITVTVSDTGCP